MDNNLTINDIKTLYDWAVNPNSANFKVMRRTAIKAKQFPIIIDKRGTSPKGHEYLMRIKVLGKKIDGNAVECCIVTHTERALNPTLTFANYVYPIGNVLTVINGHVFDRYCERHLHTEPRLLETKELADVWTEMRQGMFHFDELRKEITTSTDYGLVFGKIDMETRVLTFKTFVNSIKLYPDQSLTKRKLREDEKRMADLGLLGTMDIETAKLISQ